MRKREIQAEAAMIAAQMRGLIMAFEHRPMEEKARNEKLVERLIAWRRQLIEMSPKMDRQVMLKIDGEDQLGNRLWDRRLADLRARS